MTTEKQIGEAAYEYADRFVYRTTARQSFTSGAKWMQEQKQKEIDELVTALEEIGNIVYGHEWYDDRSVMNSRIEDIKCIVNKYTTKNNQL